MRCPHCNVENSDPSIYCEQCGALLHESHSPVHQAEYKAPPPPPLNGHARLIPHPAPAERTARIQARVVLEQAMPACPARGLFGAVLYFIGLGIAAFGVMETFLAIGVGTQSSASALLAGIALLIAGFIFFLRVRRRATLLRWWQRLLWILVASAGAFIVLIFGDVVRFVPLGPFAFTSCVTIMYGLLWAAIGLL